MAITYLVRIGAEKTLTANLMMTAQVLIKSKRYQQAKTLGMAKQQCNLFSEYPPFITTKNKIARGQLAITYTASVKTHIASQKKWPVRLLDRSVGPKLWWHMTAVVMQFSFQALYNYFYDEAHPRYNLPGAEKLLPGYQGLIQG